MVLFLSEKMPSQQEPPELIQSGNIQNHCNATDV